MVKHTQTICWQKSTNCLSVFDHFVKLPLKGLIIFAQMFIIDLRLSFEYTPTLPALIRTHPKQNLSISKLRLVQKQPLAGVLQNRCS